MAEDTRLFYLVWSPTGSLPPRYRHYRHEDAHREAERLALANPGAEFYVLCAVSRSVKTPDVTTTRLDPVEEIPF